MAGAGGRSWRDLLAGRARKRRSPFGSGAELQGAALRLLDQHQNLAELLLEVGDSAKPGVQDGAEHRGVSPESFIVSVLQEQASKLGVPTATLAAKNAMANMEQICQDPASPSRVLLLNSDQRKRLTCLLQTVKDLLANNMFCRSLFCQEMWKMKEPLGLEAVWHLHSSDIVGLAQLLDRSPAGPAAVEWLCSSLCGLCEQAGDISCGDTELAQRILSDFAIVFVQHGFEQPSELGRKVEFQKVAYICRAVLQRMLAWVLDAVGKEKQEDVSMVQAVRFWLNVFNVPLYGSVSPPDSLRQFFRHTLTEVLTYNPVLKVSDAIQMQKEWSFTRTSPLLTALYRKLTGTALPLQLLVAFSVQESVCQLQQVLETHEVNWQHVLSCVSTLVVCQAEAGQLFKDLLSHLLLKAFGNYDMENMITAFLLARQAALEGPAVFMPYSEWFKASFGSAGGHHGSSKKSLVFLLEFLSELVPFEAAPYLKVHIMFPPCVPAKHRSLLLEYLSLAKTRLADLQVAIEDMGLYEDLSAPEEAVQPQAQALRDVEKALQIFESTRKIPTSVIEASIFRRPYYTSWFLPALLRPRVLPKTPDGRMAFIDSLKRADKIPSNLYSTYLQACHAMKEKVLQDASKAEPSHSKEPLEQLEADLAELRTLVVQQAQWEEVAAQLAVLSDRLRRALGEDTEAAPCSARLQVPVPTPGLAGGPQRVVDLLLTSFCQILLAASSFNPPDRQGPCLSLLVKMLCGHRNLLPALLARLCQLLYHQGPSLGAAHILGLAAFVIHLSECRALIPAVEADFGASQAVPGEALSVSEFWSSLLVCRTEESFVFCLRFCTAAAAYLMCKFSSCSREDFCALIPPGLIKKLQFLVPRLSLEARGILCEEAKSALSWSSLSCPSLNPRRASLCLWRQAGFQELLKEKAFQLSFREWLLLELEVCPEKDILSAAERQDFHHWAIYQRYLPAPSAAGGCDGDLEKACGVILNAILDSSQRLQLGACAHSRTSLSPEILCRLQKNVSSRGYALSYDITAHFFRGLLSASLDCEDAAEGVSEALAACQTKCPVLLLSAALWWPRLEPALCSQWKRLFGAPLAGELARLRGWHSSGTRFLCSGAAFPVCDPPWLSAAFLHGAILQHSPRGTEALQRLGTGAEQLLVALLFFSLLDLISARIAPKEGVDVQTSLERSLQILQCLQGRGTAWPLLFHSAEEAPGRFHVLHSAASQRHTRLLPLAFYSLTPSFQQQLLQQEPTFLSVALQMYIQLLQLFVEGQVLPQSDQDLTEQDPLELISAARQFLLGAIPHCPAQSLGSIQPLLSTCEELDPELAASILHFSRPAVDVELEEELELF
ncbi:Fanconi anemia group A protein isoform 4-T4 [Geothlypis trichas]